MVADDFSSDGSLLISTDFIALIIDEDDVLGTPHVWHCLADAKFFVEHARHCHWFSFFSFSLASEELDLFLTDVEAT